MLSLVMDAARTGLCTGITTSGQRVRLLLELRSLNRAEIVGKLWNRRSVRHHEVTISIESVSNPTE